MRNGVIISDCSDDNAVVRQQTRFASIFGFAPSFIRLNTYAPDVEAAGNLIDVLDAINATPKSTESYPAVVLVNVAPRGDAIKAKWDNGTPFCYFWAKKTLVVSTYDGLTLSLVQKLGIASCVNLLDIPTVVASLVSEGILKRVEAKKIIHTQFRSFEFLPLIAYWLCSGKKIPSKQASLYDQGLKRHTAWHIDNFGNIKTSALASEIVFNGSKVTLSKTIQLPFYTRLADVPGGILAVVSGSSGYGKERFLEIVKQRDSAASELNLVVGSKL